ncbi:hypothetical protein PHLH8_28130 [Pseudomonas sp. Pc102]|nr:hypothetical protein PHLH8_28130 [Pseudomonas sp. Pc102]
MRGRRSRDPNGRHPHGAAVLAAVAVVHPVPGVVAVHGALVAGAGMAGDARVVELPRAGVQVQGEVAVAGFQLAGGASSGVGAAVAQFATAVQAVRRLGGDAVVEGVDHAAHRIAAIQQCRRAAHHLDALGIGRVIGHGVVVGERGSIQRADAIAQDADAVAIEATDHRATGGRAEVGGGDAGQAVEGFPQLRRAAQAQLVAFHHAGGRGEGFAFQRIGGDHLLVEDNGLRGEGVLRHQQCGGDGRVEAEESSGHRSLSCGLELQCYNITISAPAVCVPAVERSPGAGG